MAGARLGTETSGCMLTYLLRYIGNFVDGKRSGQGTTILKDGTAIKGNNTRDRFMTISGKGTIIDNKKRM